MFSSLSGTLKPLLHVCSNILRLHKKFKVSKFNLFSLLLSNYTLTFSLHVILQDLPDLVSVKDADFSNVDAVFCCLPHGTTQVL